MTSRLHYTVFGCHKEGEAKITFGTGAFALMVTGSEIINKPELGLLPTLAWQLENQKAVYALDGGVFTASSAINWAQSLGLFEELSEINAFYTPPAIESGLAFVPALAGLGCPHWEPNARGVWVGLSISHGREQMIQSILEGVAFRAAEVINAMNKCVALNGPLRIDGGMSKNPYFVQFLADVSEREVCPAAVPETDRTWHCLCWPTSARVELPEMASQFGSHSPKIQRRKSCRNFSKAVSMSCEWATDKEALR